MSWWRTGDRYGVLFNRDEQKSRPRADPPSIIEDGFMAPRDPEGGGTWLSVNENGLIIALLNRWQEQPTIPLNLRSRGLLVWDLANAPDAISLGEQLHSLNLSAYAPFTILAIDARSELRWDWTEARLTPTVPTCPVSSSSFETEQVLQARERTFNEMVAGQPGQVDLDKFHQESSQGAYSPRMCRPDAQTWSRSHIVVTESQVHWKYLEEFVDFNSPPAVWISTLIKNHPPFSENSE